VLVGEHVPGGVDHDAGAQALAGIRHARLEEVLEEAVEERVAEGAEGAAARRLLGRHVHDRGPDLLHHLDGGGAAQKRIVGVGGCGRDRGEDAQRQDAASYLHARPK